MGSSQGIRCADVTRGTKIGCKLARGLSTHKAVYAGTYTNEAGDEETAVVVKEGGLRYPLPYVQLFQRFLCRNAALRAHLFTPSSFCHCDCVRGVVD